MAEHEMIVPKAYIPCLWYIMVCNYKLLSWTTEKPFKDEYDKNSLSTLEPVLKDHPISRKKCGLSRQVVSGVRFSYIEM